jgi:small subunit ribosomal protein S11
MITKPKNTIFIAHLYVKCSLKNTIISLTKNNGNVLKQWSTKSLKKTKFKKNTPYNVQFITYQMNQFIKIKKIQRLNIHFNGTGLGRYNVLKNLNKKNLKIGYLFDQTAIPFNGCRQKKMKRR